MGNLKLLYVLVVHLGGEREKYFYASSCLLLVKVGPRDMNSLALLGSPPSFSNRQARCQHTTMIQASTLRLSL